uniref:LuxR-type transcriptional regulator n=1 Tax=Streptomyces sp. MJ635-86F5 TaxID=1321967 RepID=X5IY93_9ACTN|nr:LuxR-type transcriptional regulator [Streptomyces sp. MJ635-86F5]
MDKLDLVLDEVGRGTSATAVISGTIGMGKTSVLRSFEKRALRRRFRVLHVACTPEDAGQPYALLRRIFHDVAPLRLPAAPPGAAEDASEQTAVATRQALDRLARLAVRYPVIVGIDDIDRADALSLRSLHDLVQTAGRRPIAFACTGDWQYDAKPAQPFGMFRYHPAVLRLHLDPLPVAAVADLVAQQHGEHSAGRLAADLHARTGGNPRLVEALLGGGDREFRRVLRECLHRLDAPTAGVARALAVLGEDADLLLLSQLAGTSFQVAEQCHRTLSDTGIVDGLRFRHEVAAAVLLDDMSREEETRLRHRAALLLHQSGKPSTVIARRLLAAGPLAQDWTLPVLADAAQHALAHNQAALSVRYLDLLSACHTDADRRDKAQAEAALVDWLRAPADSIPRLRAVKEIATRGHVDADVSTSIAEHLLWNLQFTDGADIVRGLAAPAEDEEPPSWTPDHLSVRLLIASTYPGIAAQFDGLPAALPHPPDIMAMAAWPPVLRARHALHDVLTRRADQHTIARAEQVLQDSGFSHDSLIGIGPALLALVYADLLGPAAAWCDRFMNGDGSHDVPAWRGVIGATSALVSLREGRLDVAVEEAQAALAHLRGPEWNESFGLALATLAEAHTAIGSHEAAAELFARPVPPALSDTRSGLHYLHARGRHHLATGQPQAAVEDFLACGERMVLWKIDTPSLALWREGAAEAFLALGRHRRAAAVIGQTAPPAGVDLLRSRGIHLRCLAAVRGVQERPPILEQALQALQQSGDRYQTAQALADLSETYRSLGDNAKARAAARRARRIAESCHADKLCQTLISAYVPSVHQAADAADEDDKFTRLSDSERRVAILAAQGYTNREISRKLHITVSTVEQHLTRIYRKMRIKNRDELPTNFHIDTARIM